MNVTTASFEKEVLDSPRPVVVDFWAPWCAPCRQIGPILEDLSATYEGKVLVAKVNVDQEPQLASAFGVSGIPTLIVFRERRNVGQMVGFRGRTALEDLFADLARQPSASA